MQHPSVNAVPVPAGERAGRGFSIRAHLAALVCIALVPVILFASAMLFLADRHQHQTLQAKLQEQAQQLAAGVDYELRRTTAKLEVLALATPLSNGDLAAFHALARRVVAADPKWQNVVLIGRDAHQLVNARVPYGRPLPPLSRPDLPARAVRTRQPVVSDLAQAVVAGRPLTAVYIPVVQDNEVAFVLAAAIEPPSWRELVGLHIPSDMYALLLDGASVPITTTDDFAVAPHAAAPIGTGSAAIAQRIHAIAGRDAYVAIGRSAVSGWIAVTYVPAGPFDAEVRRSGATLALGFVVLLLFALLLAVLLGNRTARSISELVAAVKAVARGDAPPPIGGHVAELTEAGDALVETAALLAERLRAEQAARQQVEQSDRAKNSFMAMLGHELRNPLAAMRNAVQVMKRAGALNEKASWAANLLDRQSAHAARLVDDLLDLARVQQGKIELRRQRVDLRAILHDVVEDQGAGSGATQRLVLEVPDAPVWIDADPGRMTQVVANLLHNALKFTPKDGEVRLSLAVQESSALVRVRDSGVGIAPHLLERIFDPFAQGEQEAARGAGGLGLGLALVKSLVERHGGTVRASSGGRGTGAEFVVTLPLVAAPA